MPIMRRVLAIASLPQASTALRLRSSLFALAQASSSLLLCIHPRVRIRANLGIIPKT